MVAGFIRHSVKYVHVTGKKLSEALYHSIFTVPNRIFHKHRHDEDLKLQQIFYFEFSLLKGNDSNTEAVQDSLSVVLVRLLLPSIPQLSDRKVFVEYHRERKFVL